jgi:hypothetical protein
LQNVAGLLTEIAGWSQRISRVLFSRNKTPSIAGDKETLKPLIVKDGMSIFKFKTGPYDWIIIALTRKLFAEATSR